MQQHWTYVLNLKLSVWPSFLVYKIRGSCYRSCLADVAKHYKTWPLSGLAYTLLKRQGSPVSTQDMEGCPPLRQHAMCLSKRWEAELPQTHCRWKPMLSDGRVSQRGCQLPVYFLLHKGWLNSLNMQQLNDQIENMANRPRSDSNLWQLAWKPLSTSLELMSIKVRGPCESICRSVHMFCIGMIDPINIKISPRSLPKIVSCKGTIPAQHLTTARPFFLLCLFVKTHQCTHLWQMCCRFEVYILQICLALCCSAYDLA